ncbi:FluC/FEX family fluoride channel [Bifidobacterium pseudolongum]|uniref:FluC/FEX family fluoride channel n=1 Tax=Bifidobacterium pseudolongum TaxID=1694 RepID=UPI00209FE6A7|nr:CrcB family protein [Bifidobacterium pseudolongum]
MKETIKGLLAVGAGCAAGAIARFLLGIWFGHAMMDALSICIINLLGCLLMGVLTSIIEMRQPSAIWAKTVTTGFCGGLTSFSTFCSDSLLLFQTSPMLMLGVMLISLAGGVALYVIGRRAIHVPHGDVI